jgi:hypothetical protein
MALGCMLSSEGKRGEYKQQGLLFHQNKEKKDKDNNLLFDADTDPV